jgi:trehalose-6-phosphate synthase
MKDALLTNPWHVDGMARDLLRALEMPEAERLSRHARLAAGVGRTTAASWAEDFLAALQACRSR